MLYFYRACLTTVLSLNNPRPATLRTDGLPQTDLVVAAATSGDSQTDKNSPSSSSSYSRCLEHDGQLFSIQFVPPPRSHDPATPSHPPHPPPAAATGSGGSNNNSRATSDACELGNPHLDFDRGGGGGGGGQSVSTPLQRWFGLRQYVLLRALGQSNESGGMDVDQLLWATTVAAGNCKCSVPVLVSCGWDGLDRDSGGGRGEGVGGGASCKGYSAPGSKGVSCSVRFQTASTANVRARKEGRKGGRN